MILIKILCLLCVLAFAGSCWMWIFFQHWYWLGFAGLAILFFVGLNFIIDYSKNFNDDPFNRH